ncbi:MAG TPA: sigma-70 family RNA polymerase sigma factor [Acidobacteriaceae bacterium]|jgi:RNA polymerase sigma-70 factor (ECF subfamily)|nr:sigma-70 family RNA polymerase sigma factor [Acidobacteriaceae bacterium]
MNPLNPLVYRDLPLKAHSGARTGLRQRSRASLHEREHRELQASTADTAMLYLRRERYAEPVLEFCSFDASYIDSLCAGDRPTQDHFVGYFTTLLQLKLRSRLQSPQAVEDVRQETFARVLKALRNPGTLRQPERLGAFVNTVCNNVLFEHYRASSRSQSLDEEGQPELPAVGADALDLASQKEMKIKVREILVGLAPRDRLLLKAVFLDERDRDDVCREFGVEREYLRVLLHRAKQEFKVEYLKRMGNKAPLGMNS